jgi:pimeloyl-ACP methyl ester carboxylesterase
MIGGVEPVIRYAESGRVSIAYQVMGDGPGDLVCVFGWVTHMEQIWQGRSSTRFFDRLASFSRLILFDKRGTGLSDPVHDVPTLDERMDDLRAVMDAAGSERAAIFGVSEGGPMSILFAATYPDRVSHLILTGTFPRLTASRDYPAGQDETFVADFQDAVDHWGDGRTIDFLLPDRADDPERRAAMASLERRGASPSVAQRLLSSAWQIDVRDILPAVHVPTLIHHRQDDRLAPVQGARYMAEAISGSELFIQPGSSHFPWVDGGTEVVDKVEEFLTGSVVSSVTDRILATVLFTDIVDSTARASRLGDVEWGHLLDEHDAVTVQLVEAHRGRLVRFTGDGAFAVFDRPTAAVDCASVISDQMERLGLPVRIGVHTGECEVRGDDLGGLAVHIGARVMSRAGSGEVLVSRTVRDLMVGSKLSFSSRGVAQLKGVPGTWELFAIAPSQ